MDMALLGFVVVVGFAVFLFEWGMLRSVYAPARRDNKKVKERIERLKQKKQETPEASLVKDEYRDKSRSFYKSIENFPGVATLSLWLEQSGQNIRLEKFLLTCASSGLVGFILFWLGSGRFFLALLGGLIGVCAPIIKLYLTKQKRLAVFDEQLPEALDIITRALRAGHPFNHAIHLVSEELNGPIGEEMAIAFAELNYGVSIKDALQNLIRRVPSKALKTLVTAILLQRETGGNLAEILEKIGAVVRGSYRFQRKLRTLSAEGKMSAMVLAGVPIVLGLGLYAFAPDVISELFRNPKGISMLYGSAGLYVVGFFWINRVIRIDV